MLITLQEVQALGALIQKTPMSFAEQLWVQMLINRLLAYAQPKPPKKDPSLAKSEKVDHDIDLDLKQPGPGAVTE